MPSAKVTRAIRAFEKAVEDKISSKIMVPRSAKELVIIEHNYIKARAKLERLMENV